MNQPQNLRQWREHLQRTDSSLRWDSTLGESGSMKDLYEIEEKIIKGDLIT